MTQLDATGLHHFSTFDGLRIAFECVGPADDEVPVVLSHGFAVNANLNWLIPGICAALVDAGRRVVMLDARGHGRSDAPHEPVYYGESNMARDLLRLMQIIGAPRVDLVGYSMGAIVALLAACDNRRIRRLVVGGVGASVVELGGVDTRVLDNRQLAEALEASEPPTAVSEHVRVMRKLADDVGADRLALAAHARSVHASPIPVETVSAATLVISGLDDSLAPRPEVLATRIPNARLQRVPGDHMSALFEPSFVGHTLSFLAADPNRLSA